MDATHTLHDRQTTTRHESGATSLPATRYQGSKRKLAAWIWSRLAEHDFTTALDAFGGTGSVAYTLKAYGKRVTCNDCLAFNEQVGIALIENDRVQLSPAEARRLLAEPAPKAGAFIQETFRGIYFTDEENAWLDQMCARIRRIRDRRKRAIAWYALGQAAISKRPYNLFHRANLYMRTANVKRTFGNKRTWDRPFDDHWLRFVEKANAAIIDGHGTCRAIRMDVLEVPGRFDLVYLDPPYVNGRGVGVDYAHFYHFLDGMIEYDRWPARIDWRSKHRRMTATPNPWCQPAQTHEAFKAVFERYRDSILAVSYRSDGIPSIEELEAMLRRCKRRVEVHRHGNYQYALSTNRRSQEVLLIGW